MKKEFGRITIPVDGSDIAKKAAKKAFFLAKSTGIKAVAMHVVNTPMSRVTAPGSLYGFEYYTQLHELLQKQGHSYLDEIEKRK
jgi:nucleotide-binding universal stress UspA family protein